MAKRKFYSLSRYKDRVDGKIKTGYFMREGFDVPNNLGLNLAVYRAIDNTASTNWKEVKTWFVVDKDCGLSVGQGGTKNEAITNALEKLVSVDMDLYNNKKEEIKNKYGPVPGHGVMYLH